MVLWPKTLRARRTRRKSKTTPCIVVIWLGNWTRAKRRRRNDSRHSTTFVFFFFFSSRRRHTRFDCDWSSDVCSSDLGADGQARVGARGHLSHLQRRLLGNGGRGLGAASAVRGRAASWAHFGRARARRGRGAWSRRVDGDPGLALARARESTWRTHLAARPRPWPLGSSPDRSRSGRARARRGSGLLVGP